MQKLITDASTIYRMPLNGRTAWSRHRLAHPRPCRSRGVITTSRVSPQWRHQVSPLGRHLVSPLGCCTYVDSLLAATSNQQLTGHMRWHCCRLTRGSRLDGTKTRQKLL